MCYEYLTKGVAKVAPFCFGVLRPHPIVIHLYWNSCTPSPQGEGIGIYKYRDSNGVRSNVNNIPSSVNSFLHTHLLHLPMSKKHQHIRHCVV